MISWAEHFKYNSSLTLFAAKIGETEASLRAVEQRCLESAFVRPRESKAEMSRGTVAVVDLSIYEERHIRVREKSRLLTVPREPLKSVQKAIANSLYPFSMELSASCRGYRPQASPKLNALPHCNARYVQKLDIENFFESITRSMVHYLFAKMSLAANTCELIANLCTFRDHLPLGAPTSPAIANLLLDDLDRAFDQFAESESLTYTRYADDLTFSSSHHAISPHLLEFASAQLDKIGLILNEEKSVMRKRGQSVTVTGLVVWDQDTPRLPKSFKRRLRQELYFCERFGLESHADREYDFAWIDATEEPERHQNQVLKHLAGKIRYALGVERMWTTRTLAKFPRTRAQLVPDGAVHERVREIRLQIMQNLVGKISDVKIRSGTPSAWTDS